MLFYSLKPDSFLDGYILGFFLILIAMLHLLGNPPIPGNSSFDEATLRHLLFFIQKCSCDFLCELKFFHFRSYFPVFAIPFFFLFQHFCIFFCKFFASYTLFVLEWMLISIWNVFGFSFLNVTPENLTFGDFIHFYAFYYSSF